MLRKLGILLFTTVFTTLVPGDVPAQIANRTVLINSDNGLSQNSVYAISKDAKGFIWIGTGDGLNRYDGKEFVIFRNSLNKEFSLDGFTISSNILEDENNRLWFSTERNLLCFDPANSHFTSIVPFGDSDKRGNKLIISIDSTENLVWFLSPGNCLYNYNYHTKKFNQFRFPVKPNGQNLFIDAHGMDDGNGNIWITSVTGLYRFEKNKRTWIHEIVGKNFITGCISQDGNIWLLNGQTVFKYDPQNADLVAIPNPEQKTGSFYSIVADDEDNVWIGTLDGDLFKSNGRINKLQWKGNIRNMTGSENVSELHCIYYDPAGLLWIGTEGGGVVKFNLDHTNFQQFPKARPIQQSIYTKALYSDSDGKLWIGTFKKWIYLLNPKTLEISKLPLPVNTYFKKATGVVYAINRDENGIYWIGYDGILIAYDKAKERFYFHPVPPETSLSSSFINHIRVDKGYLMLATTSGVYKVITSDHGSKAKFEWIYRSAASETLRAADGSLWLSSQYEGLINISEDGVKKKQFGARTGMRCIIEDPDRHIIWAATQSGLMAYHTLTGLIRFYDESDGLVNPYLYGIVRSGDQIWVSSNGGIARGNVVFKKGSEFPEITFKIFAQEAGLQSDEFNTGAYYQMTNGTIVFGGINGINWFRPDQIETNIHKPAISLTGLKINDSMYDGTPSVEYLDRIKANHNKNTFLIKFVGMEFHEPGEVHYRFMLEGLDNKWTEEKSSRQVRYANLSPGKYIFRIFAINSDGIFSDEARLSIEIMPPFYKTWWFITFMVFVFVFLIVVTTKYISQIKLKNRIRVLEKEKAIEEERHRISKEMHDDLGAGLTQISLISEAAKRRGNQGNFPQRELNDIADTSKQLIENVSEIIWALNPDFDSLTGMIAYLREQISKLLEYSNKEFKLKIPESFEDRPISNLKRKNIIMLVKEAVNNAIKHSNAKKVCVEIKLPPGQLRISVCDDGDGFDALQSNGGNGLKNYRYRTGLLGGTVNILSDNNGTSVDFEIPLRQ